MFQDRLIYGKNQLQRLVNAEIENDKATLFIEDETGTISTQTQPNKFWALTANNTTGKKLEGNLHYKYGHQFTSKTDRSNFINNLRKKNSDFFTIYDEKESFLTKDGYTFYKGMKHTDPSMLSFDIESTGLFHNKDSKVLLISNTFRKNGVVTRKLFAYDEYSSQGEMLVDWCDWVWRMNPSIILGHNIYTYDLPYLNHVAEMNGVSLNLGRNSSEIYINPKPSQFRVDGSRSQEYNRIRIYGRDVIDTMFLAIKYDTATKKYDSYGLKNIIKQEGLEKTDRVMYDAGQIRFQYQNPEEWPKIKAYCEHDADDSLALYDLMGAPFFYLTQSVPKTFQGIIESATGSQINLMMIRSYLQEGHSIPKASPAKPYEGAISIGEPGNYSNCVKWDVASLYPSIILECEVYDEDKDPKANFLKIMKTFTEERLKNKALAKTSKYHDDLQSAAKIFINSGYGFLGTDGLQFNSPQAAEFITKTGREILITAIEWATGVKYEK
jgi:DNA polymerase, archaea type